MKKISVVIYKILPAVITGILVAGAVVFAWNEPLYAPPNSSALIPINVSDNPQWKTGLFGVATDGIDNTFGLTIGSSTNTLGIKTAGPSYFQGLVTINNASTGPAISVSGTGAIVAGTGGITLGGANRTTWPSGGGGGEWTTSGNNIYNTNTGYVGIGTSSPPAYPLTIAGTGNASGILFGNTGHLYDDGSGNIFFANSGAFGVKIGCGTFCKIYGGDFLLDSAFGLDAFGALNIGKNNATTINIGTGGTNLTGITIGKSGINTVINGYLGVNSGVDTAYRITTSGGGIKAENNSATITNPAGYFANAGGGPAITAGTGGITLGGVNRTAWPSGGTGGEWTTSGNDIYNSNYNTGKVLVGASSTTQSTNQKLHIEQTLSSAVNPTYNVHNRLVVTASGAFEAIAQYNKTSLSNSLPTTSVIGAELNEVAFNSPAGGNVDYIKVTQSQTSLNSCCGSITNGWYGYESNLGYNGGTGSVNNAYYYHINSWGNPTISNAYGFRMDDLGTNVTSKLYGIYLSPQTSNPATKYGIYVADTGKNYFAGNVGIGTNNPGSPLTVWKSFTPSLWNMATLSSAEMIGASSNTTGVVGLEGIATSAVTGSGGAFVTEAYGVLGSGRTANDAYTQYALGGHFETVTHPGDIGYALYADNDSASTGGTQYGLYIRLDDPDVTTKYGIYQQTNNPNYFAGDISLGAGSRLVLGSSTSIPTGTNGAMYYDSTNNKFKCYQGGAWTDCIGTGSGGQWATSGINIYNTNTGNVGIGTTTPTANLTVAQGTAGVGTVATNGTVTLTGTGTQFLNTFKVGDTITVSGETVRTIATIPSNTSLTVTSAFSTTASSLTYTLTGGTRMVVLGNGNVGIGTQSPAYSLTIPGQGVDSASSAGISFGNYGRIYESTSGDVYFQNTNGSKKLMCGNSFCQFINTELKVEYLDNFGTLNLGTLNSTSVNLGTGTNMTGITIGKSGINATINGLVLGSSASDPTGTNGAMYYSSTKNKFRCYEGGTWKDCIGTGGGSSLWTQATANAQWAKRETFASTVFNDGSGQKLWIVGGYGDANQKNDVWYSSDGTSWTQATAAAQFLKKSNFPLLVFNSGSGERLWTSGGFNGTANTNDVWYSANGISWTQATANAQWAKRASQGGVVFNGKMWIYGGIDGITYFNDVWYSSDGTTWTKATTNAQWVARAYPGAVVFNNKMWVTAGTTTGAAAGGVNDVWYSSDGTTWTKATTNAQWIGRYGQSVISYNTKILLMMGRDTAGIEVNDVWYSSDGISWTSTINNAEWIGRYISRAEVFNNKIWIMGGQENASGADKNDVWYTDIF